MKYWLLKTEPSTFSWHNLVTDGQATWDGVRNYQARNNLKAMKTGDLALIYHSVKEKNVMGIAVISKEFFKDPTSEEEQWVAVEVKPMQPLNKPISLEDIKKNPSLATIALIKQSRLSVLPLSSQEFDTIINMSKE